MGAVLASSAWAAGKYTLAYWRESGAYENQAPPAGELGHVIAGVHVWDESGQPLAGKAIYTSWGVYLGSTDEKGYRQLDLYRPNGYDFQVRDGSNLTDTTPVLSVERPPSYGHYSFEIGFLYKQNSSNPGVFDTLHLGTINAQGTDPCRDLSAPHTRSLAYYSTAANQYCSDQYELGKWTASHGQTFVANGNRIVAMKAAMAAGLGVHHYWTAQILEGGPNGVPIGPPSTSRLHLDQEYYSLLVRWGVNDVQVEPGRAYYLKITRDQGLNAYRVNRNNYPAGHYHENGNSIPGAELMGMVVCGTFTNSGPTGTLSGEVLDASATVLGGATVSIPDLGLYATTMPDGRFELPFVPVGTYQISAARTGFITGIQTNVVIQVGQVTETTLQLEEDDSVNGGVILSTRRSLQPFEASPNWSSVFDASWGSAANFTLVSAGQTGNGLQASRGGTGSSVRAQYFPVAPNTDYEVSIWMRCPGSTSDYWVECGYRLGARAAQDFDANAGAWTLLTKFSDGGPNGNGDIWTRYAVRFNSGAATQVSVGLKVGASAGTGPTVLWDELAVTSLDLPSLASAVVESPTRIQLRFEEPVGEATATNLDYYAVHIGASALPVVGAVLADESTVLLETAAQAPGVDYQVAVRNVTSPVQPADVEGLNGEMRVRVPLEIVSLDEDTLWRFHEAGGFVPLNWKNPDYDDSAWAGGAGLFGYADGVLPVPIRTPLAMVPGRVSVYFRHRFEVPNTVTDAILRLRTVVDDGAVFWLNGEDWFRLGLSNATVIYLTPANRQVGLASWEGPFDLPAPSLMPGTNLLAVEVHQNAPSSTDAVFGASLEALVLPSQFPQQTTPLSIALEAGNVVLRWQASQGLLQSSTNLLGHWEDRLEAVSPYEVPDVERAEFFRLRP